jgi:hypothetical protein
MTAGTGRGCRSSVLSRFRSRRLVIDQGRRGGDAPLAYNRCWVVLAGIEDDLTANDPSSRRGGASSPAAAWRSRPVPACSRPQ